MRRRTILGGLLGAVGIGAAGYGGSLGACALARRDVAMLKPLLIALDGLQTPERIGQAWLAEEDPATTAAALLADRTLVQATLIPDPEARRAQVMALIQDQFARGDIVVADRWVVSRIEARLAALWLMV